MEIEQKNTLIPLSKNTLLPIFTALIFLEERCDGAQAKDGQGFNGTDTEFGLALAQKAKDGKNFSQKMIRAAAKMLIKYQNTQLKPADIILPTENELDLFFIYG